MLNGWPPRSPRRRSPRCGRPPFRRSRPTRGCTYSTGPGDESLIAIAMRINAGAVMSSETAAMTAAPNRPARRPPGRATTEIGGTEPSRSGQPGATRGDARRDLRESDRVSEVRVEPELENGSVNRDIACQASPSCYEELPLSVGTRLLRRPCGARPPLQPRRDTQSTRCGPNAELLPTPKTFIAPMASQTPARRPARRSLPYEIRTEDRAACRDRTRP